MEKTELRALFENEYPGKEKIVEQLIKPIFAKAKDTTKTDERELSEADKKQIKSFRIIAQVRGGFPITFADVELQDSVALKRSRVNIQSCVRKIMADDSNAIIFFHFSDNAKEWRVSYCHRATSNKESTDAKRYTYLCGTEHACRTIAERFDTLKGLTTIKDEDMLNAFGVEPLSKEFFDQYREHYADLVEYISGKRFVKKGGKFVEEKTKNANGAFKNVFDGDDKLVRDYVKKMMGRLVFLHFLQKKGWLGVAKEADWGNGDKNFIYNLFENAGEAVKKDFLEQALEPLFFKTLNTDRGIESLAPKAICDIYGRKIRIPYLNGGLFEEDELDKKKVKFKEEHFKTLLEFFNQYNFTIDETDPDDQEIGVDPEMLGKIFENLLEDNKDKGAFYTPKEIVQYMCRESLIAYLNEKIKLDTRAFVINHEIAFTDAQKADLLNALLDVKVCDPAVGSGAFPMGMLNELLACTQLLTGNSKTRSELKKHIVKNNIYGVDIEKGAVDIARLRFWLAIIVDEEEPIPLPNLDYKIMQGNSLLESYEGIDLSNLTKREELSGKGKDLFNNWIDSEDEVKELKNSEIDAFDYEMKRYFDINNHKEKKQLHETISEIVRKRIIELLEIKIKREREQSQNLDSKITKIRNGLSLLSKTPDDPAYIKLQKDLTKTLAEQKEILIKIHDVEAKQEEIESLSHGNNQFFLWHTWFNDVFNRPNNCNGFDIVIGNPPYVDSETMTKIMPELRKEYSAKFKCAKGNWDMFVIFFENAFNVISQDGIFSFIIPNKLIAAKYAITLRKFLSERHISEIRDYSRIDVFKNASVYPITIVAQNSNLQDSDESVFTVMDEIESIKQSLNVDSNILKAESYWDIFFQEKKIFEIIWKIELRRIEEKNIEILGAATVSEAYEIKEKIGEAKNSKDELKFINTGTIDPYTINWGFESCSYIKAKYLKPVVTEKDLKKISVVRLKQSKSPKIIVAGMSCRFEAIIDLNGKYLAGKSTTIILGDKIYLKFLLGIINSKLASFWLNIKFSSLKMAGGYLNVGTNELSLFPIPTATPAQQQEIITLVDKILVAKKADASADTRALEQEIDELVYKLYGLTPEEIAIIEK